MTRPSVGTKLGNYRLERILGEGRMGIVYLAYDEALLRRTAVKVLAWKFAADDIVGTPDGHMLAEAQLAARVSHANVVKVYGVARHGVHCFIGMEYIEGISAESSVHRHGVFSFERTNEILLQVASGLQAVHDAKVVHRDLKPENILIAVDGTTKIVDFGMALQVVGPRAAETNRAGTPLYTAPELWRGGAASPASDIYALGATCYFLLTGRPPFEAKDLQTLIDAHLTAPAPDVRALRPDVPDGCNALIQRCLAKSPADRFGSAQEVAWEARGLLRQPTGGRPTHGRAATDSDAGDELTPTGPGLRRAVFGPLDPDEPHVESEPFGELRARLAELGKDDGPAIVLLAGASGSGKTTLARRLVADYRQGGTAVYIGQTDNPERSPLHEIARHLGVVAALGDARSTVDRIIQQLAEAPGRTPALIVVDRTLSELAIADLALLGRGARASGTFRLLVTGGTELPGALGEIGAADRLRTLAVPALTAPQTLQYIHERLRHAHAVAPNVAITPDAELLVFHHTAGNLVRIDQMMNAMLLRAASEHRTVVTSRDGWSVVDPTATPASWPTAPVLDILNARRRVIGLAPRRRAASVGDQHVELVSQLPDVTSVVLAHVSGAVLEERGSRDAEVAGLANARCVGALSRAGDLLGLGELRHSAVAGTSSTCLLHRRPGTVLASVVDPQAPLSPIEEQIGRIVRQ